MAKSFRVLKSVKVEMTSIIVWSTAKNGSGGILLLRKMKIAGVPASQEAAM